MLRVITLERLMTFSALVACPYGILCVLFPAEWLGWISGIQVSGQGLVLARMYGAQVFGFGATSWLARTSADSAARRALLKGFVVVDLASLLLALTAVLKGWVGIHGWIDVLGFSFFVAAFGYYAAYPERDGAVRPS